MTNNVIDNVRTQDDGYRAVAAAVVLKALSDARSRGGRWKSDALFWLSSDRCMDWLTMLDLNVDRCQIERLISSDLEIGLK